MRLSQKLIKRSLVALAAGVVYASAAVAGTMYISLPNNTWDAGRFVGSSDANTQTATFTEFGYNQIWATSIYDLSDASIFGSFYDTNIPAELVAAGVPTSGLALDGLTTVNLVLPNCPLGQCDIDGLSPLVPPLESDNEGFLQTWDLQVLYHFDGTLGIGGPVYTGGTFKVFFNDKIGINDFLAFEGTLTSSTLQAANLDLFFNVTSAAPGFLWVDDGTGNFKDASLGGVTLHLDTNVNPPIPTNNQLLQVGTNAIRQSTLDGSITAQVIPEPASLALVGLSLAALGFVGRRRKQV